MTPRNKDTKAQEHDKGSKAGGGGAAHRECGCSSLRVREWWMLTRNSHGIEISIAGGVQEMVRDPNPKPLFFIFSFFFILDLFRLLGTKSACSASYGIKKPPITNQPAPGKIPLTQLPMV